MAIARPDEEVIEKVDHSKVFGISEELRFGAQKLHPTFGWYYVCLFKTRKECEEFLWDKSEYRRIVKVSTYRPYGPLEVAWYREPNQ